jgi:uncharacterized protein YaiE (UPF0345 family)
MPQYPFGSGALWVEGLDDAGDGLGPVQVAVLQECSINADFTLRELRGQMTFPDDIAISERRLTVTARHGRFFGALWADAVFGTTKTTGQQTVAADEEQTVPASSTYTITVDNAADYLMDLGVYYAATGIAFARDDTTASAGVYTVNQTTGVYTFDSSDASAAVKISYTYNLLGGMQMTLNNEFQGVLPVFRATFYTRRFGRNTNSMVWTLNSCVCSKVSMPARMGEFNIPNLDFQAFADPSGVVGTISSTE